MYKFVIMIILLFSSPVMADLDFNLVSNKQVKASEELDFSITGRISNLEYRVDKLENLKETKQNQKRFTDDGIEYVYVYEVGGVSKFCPVTFPANTIGWTWSQKDQSWYKNAAATVPAPMPVQQNFFTPEPSFQNFGGGACVGGG